MIMAFSQKKDAVGALMGHRSRCGGGTICRSRPSRRGGLSYRDGEVYPLGVRRSTELTEVAVGYVQQAGQDALGAPRYGIP